MEEPAALPAAGRRCGAARNGSGGLQEALADATCGQAAGKRAIKAPETLLQSQNRRCSIKTLTLGC